MKKNKPLSVVLASALVISILAPQKGFSAEEMMATPAVEAAAFDATSSDDGSHEILNIALLDPAVAKTLNVSLVEEVFSTISRETQVRIKELIAIWASQGYLINPSAQFGIVKNARGQSVILDVAEKDLTQVENDILNLLISLHGEGKVVPFVSSLIEILKKDLKYGPLVSAITPDQKLMLLSTLDATITSTAALKQFSQQTWSELSGQLELTLNRFDKNRKNQTRLSEGKYFSEFADAANATFHPTQNVQLLIDGPASFGLRDAAMANAKESINMLTWAVLDDKTGQELADLLIAKAKENVKVRLIVDGQVSQRPGYKEQVQRMEQNGVQVVHWFNTAAAFMGQHRKILIIDESLTIMGGMNPGDTYSHKAGEGKNLWRDTDVALEGVAVEQTQRLFTALWNKQIVDQKLSLKKIVKVKKIVSSKVDGRAMIIEHQPSSANDQHEILLATMKAIRGAEKTVDIENAYVIVFPSLLNEIKAAVDRGVRVRVLTNSTDSVDEPVVALPIMRSAKKLADIGAEVYLRKGSTLHSKFMIVDQRLFLIGSYNYHPRSERVEGESIAVFVNSRLAKEATLAFEKDISTESAALLDKSAELNLPINGSTLLPLRMFYDQL